MAAEEQLFDRAVEVMPGGNTRSTVFVAPHPPYAVQGIGAEVVDSDGRRLIDCNNNYTSLIHGHADAEILEAAFDVAKCGTAFGLPTHYEIEMAELLRGRTGIGQWRFSNSGTEAVMMLLRAARAATGRDLIIRFEGSYHGTSDHVVDPATKGVPATESVIVLPQGDHEAVESVMAGHGHRVAAVLIDLMPNRAGLIPATHDFVAALRASTSRHGALLAVDEVITFRLGYGGFHQHYGITPDLISVGKVIGGGFPVGAIGGSAEVLSSFNPLHGGAVSWGGTFSANPVSMAAGMAALRRFDRQAVGDLNTKGDLLRTRLHDAGIVAKGHGSLIRLVTDDPAATWWTLYHHGILAGTNGLLALCTPMTDDQLDTIAERIIAAIPARR